MGGSNFNHHLGIKSGTGFARVAPLIRQHPGRADMIIHVVMCVPMNPQRNSALLDERTKVRNKGWTE